MHTDRKIGFAMGILLIGIVAALFFRNEPLINPELPTVRREQELNDRLRERNVAVYLDDEKSETAKSPDDERQRWTLKEVLDNMGKGKKSRPSPVNAPQEESIAASESSTQSGSLDAPVPIGSRKTATADSDDVPSPIGVAIQPTEPETNQRPVDETAPVTLQDPAEVAKDTFVPPAEFEEYVVKYGDTLSGIAQKFLGSQSRYQEIYEANRDRMSSPDRLDVGKPLRIPRVASSDGPAGTF